MYNIKSVDIMVSATTNVVINIVLFFICPPNYEINGKSAKLAISHKGVAKSAKQETAMRKAKIFIMAVRKTIPFKVKINPIVFITSPFREKQV